MKNFRNIHIVKKLNGADLPIVCDVVDVIKTAAHEAGYHPVNIDVPVEYNEEGSLVIAVGGDGTMLEAMRIASKTGAIATGINLGKVGFLTDFSFASQNRLTRDLIDLFKNRADYPIENRMSVFARYNKLESSPIFNEVVLSNLYSDQLITYQLEIDGIYAGKHKANAVCVGTPTGSTAYTLSAGGGLLFPTLEVMQIVPVAPLSMSSRPIIVPGKSKVRITVETTGELSVKGDGNRVFAAGSNQTMEITASPNLTKILHTRDWSFFDMLTQKLHWKTL